MEFSFQILVIAALAGMIIKMLVGWNPWKLVETLGAAFAFILLIPLFLGLAFESDPLVIQETTNSLIEQLIAKVPSVLFGEFAGVVAGTILGVATNLSRRFQL